MVIIEDRGKQYKLKVGDVLKLPRFQIKNQKTNYSLLKSYYKNEKGEILIGSPYVKDIVVEATVCLKLRIKKL